MGRPNGSKNKPKEYTGIFTPKQLTNAALRILERTDSWQNHKENNPPTVSCVEKPLKKGRARRTDITILQPEENTDSSCGMECAALASTPTEEKSGSKNLTSQVKGWITINLSPATWWKSKTYYTGGDIHETREDAMRVTSSARVGVAYIECEVKL